VKAVGVPEEHLVTTDGKQEEPLVTTVVEQ
jgi:hypothetical protein